MNRKGERNSNEDTKSQHSIDRRSVGTAHTARSAMDLDKVLVHIYSEYGNEEAHEEIAATLYEAGLANFLEKNYSKAPEHLTVALNMYRDLQAESDEEDTYASEIADILKTLGMVYLARKELNKARQDYQKANKENEKARNNFDQALTKKREIYGEGVINIAIAELERYLGLTYLSETSIITDAETSLIADAEPSIRTDAEPSIRTDAEAAITYLSNALRDFKFIYGEDTVHIEIADTYCHLGCAYQQQNNYEQARAQFTAALGMFQEVFSVPNHVKIAETFYKIGFTYLAVGSHDKAISSFINALDIYTRIRETNPSIDPNYVDLCYHLGKTYFATGDFDSAKPHLENACLMYQGLYRSTNPNHPSIKAAENAMAETDRKRAEQSAEGHVQGHSAASVQNPSRKVAQPSTLPVASGQATDLSLESASKQGNPNMAGLRQEEKSVPVLTSAAGFFAPSSVAVSAPTPTTKPPITLRDVKVHYLKIAGMFNASKKIFKTDSLDEAIVELRNRAGNGGASADTLRHFGLSLR